MNEEKILIKTITDFFTKIGFVVGVEVYSQGGIGQVANIIIDDAGFFIGQKGLTLEAIQHLIRMLVNKQNKENPFIFNIDINNYKKNKLESLKILTEQTARRVLIEKAPITLHPMTAFERKIIHTNLQQFSDLTSESIGEEDNRRVIIKLKEIH
jgi:spoIIIJ-associated protein